MASGEQIHKFTCRTFTKRKHPLAFPTCQSCFLHLAADGEPTAVVGSGAASLCITKCRHPFIQISQPCFQSEDINGAPFVIGGQLSGQVGNQSPFTVSRQRCSHLLGPTCGCAFNTCRASICAPAAESECHLPSSTTQDICGVAQQLRTLLE